MTLAKCLLAFFVALAIFSSQSAHGQEKAVRFVPRQQMIDAIFRHAYSRDCSTVGNVRGSSFEDACNKAALGTPADAVDVFKRARATLTLQDERALIEICERHQILDCQEEASTGRPVLTFDASLSVRAEPSIGAWSPDGSRLIIYAIGQPNGHTRIIDAERVHFGPLVTEDAAPSAVAWSANGKYIALNGLKLGPMAASPSGVRLFASDTLEKKGNIAPAKHHRCNIALSQDMAFTADSKALWVSCGRYGTPSPLPIAIKLGVPGLEIEDSLFPVLLAPDTQFEFQTYEISTGNDGLALTGISRPARLAPPDYQQQMAVQSFSLETKTQLHPPVLMNLYYGDGEPFGVRTALGLHLIRDLSAVLIHFPGAAFGRSGRSYAELAELWSTARGGRLDAGQSHTIYERYLPPNRIGQSGMHLQTHANPDPSRYRRTHLIVLDSQTGATIQQLGPIATGTGGAKILVSPTGNRVALVSRDEIRFYRVNQ